MNEKEFTNFIDKIKNKAIYESYLKTYYKIKNYKKIICMISGGFDSDIMVDILTKLDTEKKIKYIFVNTGLEYKATIKHIEYLQNKYNIKIETIKPKKPIPIACREYGVPFFSKYISEMIYRLQQYNFQWENEDYEVLVDKYCERADENSENLKGYTFVKELNGYYKGCLVALKWWCNKNGEGSAFNINKNKLLKEFMIKNPPTFKISAKCCIFSKERPAEKYKKDIVCDLDIVGVRQKENGIRSTQYKNCFTKNDKDWDNYRPLFFYTDSDKKYYKETFGIISSDCYEVWGMNRTGCVGCPCASGIFDEIEIVKKYQPNIYKAIINIFGKSYEYKKAYNEYKNKNFMQLNFFNLLEGK